jgi:hypothetical protein
MSEPIIIALIGAGVAIVGWFVSQFLIRAREDRTRRLETLLKHSEKQIEEFYGPLFNIVHQIFVSSHVQYDILTARDNSGQLRLTTEQRNPLTDFFLDNYFAKLHQEVNQILKTKLYLIEGSEMPDSFFTSLRHVNQERDQRLIAKDLGIDTSFVPGVPWPEDFYTDIKRGFERAMSKYENSLGGLRRA